MTESDFAFQAKSQKRVDPAKNMADLQCVRSKLKAVQPKIEAEKPKRKETRRGGLSAEDQVELESCGDPPADLKKDKQ